MISPLQQIQFLQKFVKRQLPVSGGAFDRTALIKAAGKLPNGWELHGKTGLAP